MREIQGWRRLPRRIERTVPESVRGMFPGIRFLGIHEVHSRFFLFRQDLERVDEKHFLCTSIDVDVALLFDLSHGGSHLLHGTSSDP